MNNYSIVQVNKDNIDIFIHLHLEIRKAESQWIKPMLQSLQQNFYRGGYFDDYGEKCLFLCFHGEIPVGRIAALINHQLLDPEENPIGQLGYFECINDQQAANKLLNAGSEWFKSHQVSEVWGPINGASHLEHRFQKNAFDSQPMVQEPRNPHYYPALFENAGFNVKHNWYTYEVGSDSAFVKKYSKPVRSSQSNYVIDEPELTDPQAMAHRLYRIVNQGWSEHIGFTALSVEEFHSMLVGLYTLMKPGHLKILQEKTPRGLEDIGYLALIANYSDAMKALDGDVSEFGNWQNSAAPDSLLWYSVTVIPGRTTSSLARILWHSSVKTFNEYGYKKLIWPLATETLTWHRRHAKETRHYLLYRITLDALSKLS